MRTHYGDPCVHCGISHDDVPVGPCLGDPANAVPVAMVWLETRWDGVRHWRWRLSDGRIEDQWEHNDLINYVYMNRLRYDETLRTSRLKQAEKENT